MEIERKFLISKLPENLSDYPSHQIEQGYLTTNPVVRIRRQDDDYILTYKGGGMMAREDVGTGFQVLFHSPPGVLFTFPSQYYTLSVTG